jgi:hypothetical protein
MSTRGAVERATPKKILAVERERVALRLRTAGMTFQAIADHVGYRNRSSAADAVERALMATIQGPADDLRKLELERLDALYVPMYRRAVKGDHRAVDRCLSIMDRRSKLLGLDAPISVRQQVITDEDLEAAIARLDREAEAMEMQSRANGEAE